MGDGDSCLVCVHLCSLICSQQMDVQSLKRMETSEPQQKQKWKKKRSVDSVIRFTNLADKFAKRQKLLMARAMSL